MKAYFVDKDGREKPIIMGCYGIGVSRLMAAAVEQNHDENGIIWPENIAPFKLQILALNTKDKNVMDVAEDIYQKAKSKGIEVLFDDRDMSPGAKFKDADLIGIPYRIVVGRGVKNGKVEFQKRANNEKIEIEIEKIDEILDKLV